MIMIIFVFIIHISFVYSRKLPKVCSTQIAKRKFKFSNQKVEQEGGSCNAKSAQFMEEGGQVRPKIQIQNYKYKNTNTKIQIQKYKYECCELPLSVL